MSLARVPKVGESLLLRSGSVARLDQPAELDLSQRWVVQSRTLAHAAFTRLRGAARAAEAGGPVPTAGLPSRGRRRVRPSSSGSRPMPIKGATAVMQGVRVVRSCLRLTRRVLAAVPTTAAVRRPVRGTPSAVPGAGPRITPPWAARPLATVVAGLTPLVVASAANRAAPAPGAAGTTGTGRTGRATARTITMPCIAAIFSARATLRAATATGLRGTDEGPAGTSR